MPMALNNILENTSEYSLAPQGNRSDCNCPRILIVDDDIFCITALMSMLEIQGWKSENAINGQ
jgi:hypothetical protein